jgi:outer membrane immunogenic protein
MKFRLLSGIAITASMAGSAFAADMPMKALPPPVVAYDWGGFYVGGVIGGGWTNTDSSVPELGIVGGLFVNAPAIQTTTGSSFIGGVEGGDRYQFGKLVIGWEADITWGDMNGTSTTTQRLRLAGRRLQFPGIVRPREHAAHQSVQGRFELALRSEHLLRST